MMLRPRLMLPIGLAIILILGLCSALAGQAMSASDYTLSTADGLSLSLSTDGQISNLRIDGDNLVSAPAPALLVRDLSDAGSVITPNLVANPGFENGLAGWTEATNSGLDVSVVVSPTHSGGAALQFASGGDDAPFAAYTTEPVAVTAGQRYRVSAWWRSARGYVLHPNGTPTVLQMGLWTDPQRANGLYVQWLDIDSNPLSDPQLAVPLHWNATHWRITRRELTAPANAAFARLIIGAKVEADTLWVDDVAFIASPEPEAALAGVVTPCPDQGDCLKHAVTLSSGLALTVTYTAHADHIAVYGEVADTTGQDRALDITWGIPMNVAGWTWWDDAHNSRPITDTSLYANAISAIYDGWLPISLYPYAGIAQYPISNTQYPISNLGLALAVPLDRPQLALMAYDGAAGRYDSTFHLGISPQAVKVGSRATFDLMLYRFDPSRGFRDVIARHRALQPDAYTSDLPVYDYQGRSQGQYHSRNGALQVLADDAANVYSAQYTVGEFHVRINPDTEPKPDMDQILQAVTDTLQSPNQHTQANAQALLASAAVDTNGDWSVKKLGSFPWSQGMWEMIWAGNVDPDIEDGLGQFMLNELIDPAFEATEAIGARLDGVQIDNFQATPALDLRPEAIAAADTPLGYTPHTYQPAVHTGFAFHEYLASLRQHLDDTWGADRGITINFWGLGNPNYLAPFLDAMGSEGNLKGNGEGPNWNPEILDYRRAIAYSRPYMFANQMTGLTASEAYTFSQTALLYGVVAGSGPNAAGWEPEAQQIISDTAELVGRYWAAGWEPLTYARADSEEVWMERFGNPEVPGTRRNSEELGGTQAGLYFTVHNHTNLTRTAAITIEAAPLGLTEPASAVITDIAITQTIPFSVVGGDIVVDLTLGPRQTRVLQVSGGVAPPTPTPTPSPTATPTATPTPPASQCVGDANANGIGDVMDIQTTASDLPCQVYLPLVAAQWRQPWPTPTSSSTPTPASARYPRLHANLFSLVPEDEAAYDALSRYGAITTGALHSDGSAGGFDLGVRQGVGAWSDTTYNLSHPGRGAITQVTVYEAKKRNPNLTTFAHRGLEHIEARSFGYGTNSPQRWFIDRLSPRWFAYTPLIQLQEAVTKTSTLTFQFRPEDVQRWRNWGVRGGDELGLDYWRPADKYDWYYLSFFDNEAGAGRGTVEIMAIQSLDAQTGEVTVAVKFVNGQPKRAIYGRPQRYAAGSRAGIVPHSSESFGSPAFLMNRWCPGEGTPACNQIVVDGADWVDAAAEYVTEILMPSRYPLGAADETWLADGVIMDADDDDWKPYGFRLGDPAGAQGYHLDLNLDGQVDSLTEVNARLPVVYEEYARRLKEAAAAMGRHFYVIKNGHFSGFPRPNHNGRQFEDFNGGFQESYPDAVQQYVALFTPGNLAQPIYALVRERDRNSLYEHNFEQHRHIMALTLVLGDGYYGHTGSHASRILALYEDPSGWAGQPEDWFDEFSVDPFGYTADHPLYTGAGRSDYLGWLGRALGPGYEAPDTPGVYRRDFEHGVALYSAQGGTVTFAPPLRRICGVDPGNDGSLVTEITLAPKSGIVLRRDENTGPCQASNTLALTVTDGSDLGDLSHLTGGHINLNNFGQTAGALNDLQSLLGLENRLVRIHYALRWWADEPESRSRMTDRVSWVLEQGGLPQLDLFAFPPSWTGCPDARGSDLCKGYPPQDLAHFRQQVTDLVRQVYLPAFAAHPNAPHIYELLNEPDLPQFWNGTRQQYLDTLTALKEGILAADAGARFAGPAAVGLTTTIQGETTAVSQDFIDWFLGTGLPHDRLVTFTLHTYYTSVESPLPGNLATLRRYLDDHGLAATGIVIDEWNFRIGETALDTVTDAAFVGRRLAYFADLPLAGHTFFKLQDDEEVLPRQPFTARLGLLTSQGLRKPVFHAMRLAAMLGKTRLAVIQAGDWTERSVLAGRDTTGTVSVLIASGGELTGTLPTARLDLTFTDLTAARYDVEAYRVDGSHANAYSLKDEITAAYQSAWNDHLAPVRQALLDAGYLPDVVDSLIAGLQTDPVATLEQLKEDNPALYADAVAALDAEKPFLDADLEALATQYNADPRVDLIPETISLTPVDGRASLEVTLPAEGVLLVRLDERVRQRGSR